MRRSMGLLLAMSVLVGACQLQTVPNTPGKRPADKTAQAKTSPAPDGSAKPASPGPSEPASSPSTVPSPISTPAVPMTMVKGLVKIDPSYVISVGGGNFVSTNSGTVIATGGGNVSSGGGGNELSVGGGNVISVGGGNVISVGGGNVIATGGGNVIATGGGNYQLLADAATDGVKLAPAQGMGVVAISLTDGKPLSQPVLTDAQGRYSVQVPEAIKDNVLIVAAWPGKSADDPLVKNARLMYNLVVDPAVLAEAEITDHSSVVTSYVREAFKDKFEFFYTPDALQTGEIYGLDPAYVPDLLKPQLDAMKARMLDATKAAKVPPEQAGPLARHSADLLLAHLKLDSIKIEKAVADKEKISQYTGEPVIPTFQRIVEHLQNVVGYKLYAEGMSKAALAEQLGVPALNQARQEKGLPAYEIETPTDVVNYFFEEYLGKDRVVFDKLKPYWAAVGMPEDERLLLHVCAVSIGMRMGLAILSNEKKNANDPDGTGIQDKVVADIPLFGPKTTP